MNEPAPAVTEYEVTHALNNNAVIVRSEAGISVVVGKGIGFGRRAGDHVSAADVQEHYVAVEPDRLHYLSMLNTLSPELLAAIAGGVERASEFLGPLHPSVYLLLTDHLAFAVERYRKDATIHNDLLPEIRAVFPAEFAAAQRVLEHVNRQLDVHLPHDEAAFIALHLNAALSGDSVKAPLSRANALAEMTAATMRRMRIHECSRSNREALTLEIAALESRLQAGRARSCAAHRSIARDLVDEWLESERIMTSLLEDGMGELPALSSEQRTGEIAYLAVFLHGWAHDIAYFDPSPQQGSST